MDLTEGVGESSSPPRSFGSFNNCDVRNDVYNRLVESGHEEAVSNPELFREHLDAHFNRLPSRFSSFFFEKFISTLFIFVSISLFYMYMHICMCFLMKNLNYHKRSAFWFLNIVADFELLKLIYRIWIVLLKWFYRVVFCNFSLLGLIYLLLCFWLFHISYGLDVNVDRVEDVLLHKKLLALAKDPEKRPVYHIRFLEVPSRTIYLYF